MIKVNVNGYITLNIAELGFENYRKLVDKFTFRIEKYKGEMEIINLATREKIGEDKFLKLPCNLVLVEEVLKELSLNYEIIDERALPFQDSLVTGIELRDNQKTVISKLEEYKFNSLLTAKTAFGKTYSSIYLTQKLQTNMLFLASRRSLLENMLKDADKAGVNPELITEINTAWLENPVITPIMYCTTQTLSGKICNALQNNVGLLVADEIHLGITGEKTREYLFGLNPKYRLYLSATPENKIEGFVHTCLSANEVTAEENIPYKINVTTINMKMAQIDFWNYKQQKNFSDKQDLIYNTLSFQDFITINLVEKSLNQGRGVMIYADSIPLQERLAEYIKILRGRFFASQNIKVGVLNSNTKKKESKAIIEGFDKGDYEVLIGSSALTAGLSFERLSVVIDTSLRLNENNLTQLLGRLKRKNDEVCNRSKEYIKICYDKISLKSWEESKKNALEPLDYVTFKQLNLEYDNWREINSHTVDAMFDFEDFRSLNKVNELIKFGDEK